MSKKYKFKEKEGAYFISFATCFVIAPIDYKHSSTRNYGNDDQTILEINLN